MRGPGLGATPLSPHCAPGHTAHYGRGGGRRADRIDAAPVLSLSHIGAAAIGRPLLFTLLSLSAMAANDSRLDPFPGEKPLASDVLEWLRVNKPKLSSDHRALVDGYTPRSLLGYSSATVMPELVAGGDVTASMVANREVIRQTRIDENAK